MWQHSLLLPSVEHLATPRLRLVAWNADTLERNADVTQGHYSTPTCPTRMLGVYRWWLGEVRPSTRQACLELHVSLVLRIPDCGGPDYRWTSVYEEHQVDGPCHTFACQIYAPHRSAQPRCICNCRTRSSSYGHYFRLSRLTERLTI